MGVKNAIRYLDARRGKMPFPAVNDTHRAISVMPGDDLFRGIFFYFYLGFASDAESSPYVRRIFSRYDNRIVCLSRTFVVSPLVFFVRRNTRIAYRIVSIDPQDKVEGICVGVSGTAINLDFAGACTQETARCGAVVSEFAPNMSVPRFGFRLRNRITSGLAVATVVVEAPEKSGALLFADDAVMQGREVFAVPGNADSRASVGSNALLKDGARPATCAWDVLSDFRRMFPGTLHENIAPEPDIATPEPPPETGSGFAQVRRPVAEKRIDKPQPEAYIDLEAQLRSLTTEQLQIVAAIDAPGTQVDLIIEKTQLPASKVLAELTVLQIRGVVRQEPGKRFSLNVRAGTAQES